MNESGRAGRPMKIDLPFEEAVKAALETPPPVEKKPKRGGPRRPKRVPSSKK